MSETINGRTSDRLALIDEHREMLQDLIELRTDDAAIRDLRIAAEQAARAHAAADAAVAVAIASKNSRISHIEAEMMRIEQELRSTTPVELRALSGAIAITVAELCGLSSKYDPELDATMNLLRDVGAWCANAWSDPEATPAFIEARMLELSLRAPKLRENFSHGMEVINDSINPQPRRRFL